MASPAGNASCMITALRHNMSNHTIRLSQRGHSDQHTNNRMSPDLGKFMIFMLSKCFGLNKSKYSNVTEVIRIIFSSKPFGWTSYGPAL